MSDAESFVEEETKVDIEEASINLGRVKREPNEIDFEEDRHREQYRITLEYDNAFGESSQKRKFEEDCDNLIGFLDNDVVMENAIVKLEHVKEEDESLNNLHCSKCKENYKGFCLKCSTLTCILNNNASPGNSESQSNSIPSDIIEIRETTMGKGAFLLRTLPINLILGPFEGVLRIESTVGYSWKINDNKKLVNIKNENWMKDIVCASSASFNNLNIFQVNGNLYFQTNREITEGEELLIYFDDKELRQLDNSDECLYTPQKKENLLKIFACTLCCLGFSSNKCLMEHKRKCPRQEYSRSRIDFELIECHYCKMWMEKWEHEECHAAYCLEKHHRMWSDYSETVDRRETDAEVTEGTMDDKRTCPRGICSKPHNRGHNLFETKDYQHFSSRNRVKRSNKYVLSADTDNEHGQNATEKKYKCPKCSCHSNYKGYFQRHNCITPFQCHSCPMKCVTNCNLQRHIKSQHILKGYRTYKCSECFYSTNYKYQLNNHINAHRGIKPFDCEFCTVKFTQKSNLKRHVKDIHAENGNAKDYKCSKCSFKTNYKHSFQNHFNMHRGIKAFQCDICMMTFFCKGSLNRHTKDRHSTNENSKDYKCSECSFQTKYKQDLNRHVNTHKGVKLLECGICKMEFTKKHNLKYHIKNIHAENGSAKDYKCSECFYQTNSKYLFQNHVNKHSGTKPFQCDICLMKLTTKGNLNTHIKNKHTENGSA